MSKKIRIAIVDDHQIVLDGLYALLEDETQFRFVFSTTDPASVPARLAVDEVDVLLTDVMMPGMNGKELAKLVKQRFPRVKILTLSMSGEDGIVKEMINDADISGYVLKNIGKQELIKAIEKIAAGGIYFSNEVIDAMGRNEKRRQENEAAHLTVREIEIIGLIEKELNSRQIAEKLFISERTVETHRKNIFRKTGTNSVIGLVKYAYEHRLLC